jgi:hypothetical protein
MMLAPVFAIALAEIGTACSSHVVANSAGTFAFSICSGSWCMLSYLEQGFERPDSAHLCIDAGAARRKDADLTLNFYRLKRQAASEVPPASAIVASDIDRNVLE